MAGSTALAARMVLAGALGWAALAKLRSRRSVPEQMQALGFPRALARPLAITVPCAEAVLAIALVAFARSGAPAWCAVVLLGAFSVVIAVTLPRHVPCPCFGVSGVSTGTDALLRNALLLAVAIVATGPIEGATPASVAAVAIALGGFVAGAILGAGRSAREAATWVRRGGAAVRRERRRG